LHAVMVAVIGRACHATALVVHLFSCVVVGTDDKADLLACECHCVNHIEHKLLFLGVRHWWIFLIGPCKVCMHLRWGSTLLFLYACCCPSWCDGCAGFPL
jgi:hypothetical protein